MQRMAAQIPRAKSENLMATSQTCLPCVRPGCVHSGTRQDWTALGAGAVAMDVHARAIDSPFDPTEEEKLLIFTVSDDELEKAAGGTNWAQTNTCVRTICHAAPVSGQGQ